MPGTSHGASPSDRLSARYGPGAPATAVWSSTIDLLLQHRSMRAYASTPLPDGTLQSVVAAAQSAATSSNLQAWSVVSIEDPARRDRLAGLAGGQAHIRQAPLFLVWLADLSRATRLGEEAGQDLAGVPFLEAFLVAVIDAALAAQNAVVAAESLGLGTVYIGAIRNNPEAVARELRLPAGVMPVFGLCIGYEDQTAQAADVKPRLPQSAVRHRETYGASGEKEAIVAYDETLLSFQIGQAMPPQPWSTLVRNRLGSIKALNGRDRLREAIQSLGFGLK